MPDRRLKIVGAPGSPYSRKLRSVLRFRRIPYDWIRRWSPDDHDIPAVPVAVIPVLVFPGEGGAPDEAAFDSTPLIRRLENEYSGRSIRPPDPVLAFVDSLLEDFADEWVTKAMFHYRWAYEADIAKAASILPRWGRVDVPESQMQELGKVFAQRQIGRRGVVGSSDTTAPLIEDSYRRLLRCLDAQLTVQPYLMGGRPGASDFALFGQLTQLVGFDPTPMAEALETAPRIAAWIDIVEDLSGTEVDDGQWTARDAISGTLGALLGEVGRFYVPFLLANGQALAAGEKQVECSIDGRKWVQAAFPYQGKCLKALREEYAALGADDRTCVDAILAGTGCEPLFAR